MSGSGGQGKWMVSSVKEEDITELRAAGYLAKGITHRLSAEGQIVRGLMYYYGIDFHDLSPNSFLNISAFIVVCEAFLRIQPHSELWLKVFNVKPKVVDGQHTECGGAMVSKLSNVSWPNATFVDTIKEWQK